MKIGVTLFIRGENQSIWENGIFQNCQFLLMLLQKCPGVSKLFIVNGGPGGVDESSGFLECFSAPVISYVEAMENLDLIIELSAQLDPDWARQFHARGGRIIGMRVANDYIIDLERMVYGLDPGMLFSGTPYDQIWTIPAFAKTNASYYQVGARSKVRVMQHLWHPIIIDKALKLAPDGLIWGYSPGRSRWRIAILEPNICSVKTCHLPMLVCESTYRRRPDLFESVRIYNALNIKDHNDFAKFALSMDVVRDGVATFEGRFPIYTVLSEQADVVVSHSWHNEQNYLYYEALYGGYPLIHNSDFLDDCGYKYATFDAEDGGSALLQALACHDHDQEGYRNRSAKLLESLNPLNEKNVVAYAEAIAEALQ